MSLPPSCSRCGCLEEEHGGELDDESGENICTGCGDPCEFEPEDEIEDGDNIEDIAIENEIKKDFKDDE